MSKTYKIEKDENKPIKERRIEVSEPVQIERKKSFTVQEKLGRYDQLVQMIEDFKTEANEIVDELKDAEKGLSITIDKKPKKL